MIILPKRYRRRQGGFLVGTFFDQPLIAQATPTGGGAPGPGSVSGLIGWWDANQETYANNDPVDTWTDRSTGGHNMTQTGSLRPTFKTSVINGKPAIYFNGTTQYLSMANLFQGGSGGECFLILKGDTGQGTSSGTTGLWAMPGTDNNENVPWTDNNIYDGWWSRNRKSCGSPGAGFAQTWHTYGVISIAGEYTAFYNSTQFFTVASNTIEDRVSSEGPHLGVSRGATTYFYVGWIAEYIIYDHKLSSTDRTTVRSYINSKYGI